MRHVTEATRAGALRRVRRQLEDASFPRVQMGLIVALTGGAGLLSSFLLLRAGVDAMAWRYPLALAFAYLFFLFLLWLWLRTNAEDYVDVGHTPDATDLVPTRGPTWSSGQGGDFAGGGASGSFDDAAALSDASSTSAGEVAGSLADGDALAISLVAVALTIGLAFASLYIVYAAPALFAELLLDGVLSYTLYRRLREVDRRHWLATAVRRTAWAFGLTAVFLVALGWALAVYAPGAHSIGDVLRHAGTSSR